MATGTKTAGKAGKVLGNPKTTKTEKTVAGGGFAQAKKQTSAKKP
jgi:hypothetical protein